MLIMVRRVYELLLHTVGNIYALIFLLLIAVYFLFMPIPSNLLALHVKSIFNPEIIIGLTIKELSDEETRRVALEPWQRDYYQRFEASPIAVSLDFIFIPRAFDKRKICITELDIVSSGIAGVNVEPTTIVSKLVFDTPFCLGPGKNYFVQQESETSETKVFDYAKWTNSFWYPFDYRVFKIDLFLVKGDFDKNIVFDPALQITSASPRWISWVSKFGKSGGDTKQWEVESIRIVVARHMTYMALAILVPFIVTLILGKVLPAVINNVSTFWEIVVALILGLWTFSEALIPNYIDHPTIIGNIILFMYVPLIAYIVLAGIIRNNGRTPNTPSTDQSASETERTVDRVGPSETDNLETLKGIGPTVAKVLNESGIVTYQDLADSDPATVRRILEKADVGALQTMKIESWIEQARLAAKQD